ncbi:UNVERIFIED_CONTAM: hypothetical protein Slati_3477000 [Sesamum latifolium]|uniref:Aminotransferase-like plant mobile domain-containing protein n=1 Tax=Sesamum latifolium TaxID=2727402 RepID=A0AAW2UGF0_9LAMI
MKNIDEESTSNWDTTVLAYLYRELCTASQRGKTNIGGAMQLLQIWAWSRIITLAPISSNNVADLMPTIDDPESILPVPPYARRWSYHISRTHMAHNAIRIIRNTLDRMQENENRFSDNLVWFKIFPRTNSSVNDIYTRSIGGVVMGKIEQRSIKTIFSNGTTYIHYQSSVPKLVMEGLPFRTI